MKAEAWRLPANARAKMSQSTAVSSSCPRDGEDRSHCGRDEEDETDGELLEDVRAGDDDA
jgi:hypothetical protein